MTPVAKSIALPRNVERLAQKNMAGNEIAMYSAALCHTGLLSMKLVNVCTKSRNMQQQGASAKTTTNPANLWEKKGTINI